MTSAWYEEGRGGRGDRRALRPAAAKSFGNSASWSFSLKRFISAGVSMRWSRSACSRMLSASDTNLSLDFCTCLDLLLIVGSVLRRLGHGHGRGVCSGRSEPGDRAGCQVDHVPGEVGAEGNAGRRAASEGGTCRVLVEYNE